MARQKTTRLETYYFEQFLRHFALPAGDVNYGGLHDDKPDLTVTATDSDKILLGVEQTRLFVESGETTSSEQVQAKWRNEILKKAEAEYKRSTTGNLRLSISFNKEHPIQSIKEVVAKLVALSNEIKTSESGQLSSERISFIPEIDFIYAQWNVDAPWQVTQVHSAQLTSHERLQNILNEKDRQAAGYRICSELWLLVIIDFFDSAQDQDIDDNLTYLRSKNFAKLILFKTVLNEFKEIPCSSRDRAK